MHWYLVLMIASGGQTLDGGIMPGYVPPPSVRVELAMSSESECDALAKANAAYQPECWAKADQPTAAIGNESLSSSETTPLSSSVPVR